MSQQEENKWNREDVNLINDFNGFGKRLFYGVLLNMRGIQNRLIFYRIEIRLSK